MQAKKPNYAVPALEKGLRILETLSASEQPLALAELAERQGRGRNELYRMLNCLEREGYIERDPDTKRYGLSLKLHRLALKHPPLEQLRSVVDRRVRAIAAELGESCHACVLDEGGLSVIAQCSGGERIRLVFDPGAAFNPLETCSGKLLLAHMSEKERERQLRRADGTERSAREIAQAKAELANLSGVAFLKEPSRLRPGFEDFSVVFGEPEVALATMAVTHQPDRATGPAPEQIEAALRAAARDASRELGLGEPSGESASNHQS